MSNNLSKDFEKALSFALPAGDPIQPVYQWNSDRTDLVKVGERDAQKELNEAAIGTTVYELLSKFGGLENTQAAFPDDGNEGDFTIFPETSGEMTQMEQALEKVQNAAQSETAAQTQPPVENGQDLEAEIKLLQAQVAELKGQKGEDK